MKKEKIFEEYFKQNLNFEEKIAKIITDTVNEVLNDLPDDSPMKNRETGIEIMAAVKERLRAAS